MKRTTQTINLFTLLALIFVSIVAVSPQASAASASEIDRAAKSALRDLYAINPKAKTIGSRAAAVLVFPSIRKGGFLVAAQHGDGALISGGRTTGYYQTLAASYGLQAGVQKFGYALFFMNQKAMAHLHDHGGWELGRRTKPGRRRSRRIEITQHDEPKERHLRILFQSKRFDGWSWLPGIEDHGNSSGLKAPKAN